jgi:hypothetical protein
MRVDGAHSNAFDDARAIEPAGALRRAEACEARRRLYIAGMRGRSTCSLALAALLGGCGASQSHSATATESAPEPSPVRAPVTSGAEPPGALAVPEGQQLGFQAEAKGVQIYECRAAGAEAKWVLSAPEAELFDAAGNLAGKHFAGPTWELVDGSRVAATKLSEQTPDPEAIPWLLLRATEHQGQGSLAAVTFVVRKNTRGGLPPAGGCDAAHGGDVARVPYSALYVFYVPGG